MITEKSQPSGAQLLFLFFWSSACVHVLVCGRIFVISLRAPWEDRLETPAPEAFVLSECWHRQHTLLTLLVQFMTSVINYRECFRIIINKYDISLARKNILVLCFESPLSGLLTTSSASCPHSEWQAESLKTGSTQVIYFHLSRDCLM